MTSAESRYSIIGATPGQESGLVGSEWRYLAERALRPARATKTRAILMGIGLALETGAVTPGFPTPVTSSGPASVILAQQPKASQKSEVLRSAAEQIIAIRSLLGPNVMELAAILHVQRPTIYSWQSGTATPHRENGTRLRSVYELAQRWSRICAEPIGDWVRKPLAEDGRTLATMLSAERIDERAISGAFAELKTKLEEDARGFVSVRERTRRFGYKERSKSEQESSLDRETLV